MADMNFGVNILPVSSDVTLGNSDKKWNLYVKNINGSNGTTGQFLMATTSGPTWSNSTSSAISITNNTSSSSKSTGALTVAGGVGVGGTVTANAFSGPLTGNATSATQANITSTTNAVAYYTDAVGTFGSIASASGAFYSTGFNVKPTFGTLPVAQGGTNKTSWTQWGVLYASADTTLTNTSAGAANTALMGKGSAAPAFVSVSPSISITAGTSDAAPKINLTVLGVSGTAQSITTATTGIYGVTKLQDGVSSTSTTLAATANAAYTASRSSLHTLDTVTKLYLTGVSSNTSPNTAGDYFDSGVYLTTTAGELSSLKYSVHDSTPTEKVRMEWNDTTESLDFIFV